MATPVPTFPAIGILANAKLEPGETGTREFPTARSFESCYLPDLDNRPGMLIVDVEGRAWRVTAVHVLRRPSWLEGVWGRLWDGAAKARVDYDLVEAPSLDFEALRALLLTQQTKHRSAYAQIGFHHLHTDRAAIKKAASLRDLVKSREELALAAAPAKPPSRFEQVFGDGRLDRRGLALFMVLAGAAVAGVAAAPFIPYVGKVVGGAIILGAAAMSALGRRLRTWATVHTCSGFSSYGPCLWPLFTTPTKTTRHFFEFWAGYGGPRSWSPPSGWRFGRARPVRTALVHRRERRAGRSAPPHLIKPRSPPMAAHPFPSPVRRRGGR